MKLAPIALALILAGSPTRAQGHKPYAKRIKGNGSGGGGKAHRVASVPTMSHKQAPAKPKARSKPKPKNPHVLDVD